MDSIKIEKIGPGNRYKVTLDPDIDQIKVKVAFSGKLDAAKEVVLNINREPSTVRTIKCTSSLDKGARNDGSDRVNMNGMVYGKEYQFKVVEFNGKKPSEEEKAKVKWGYTYLNSNNELVKHEQAEPSGESFTLKIDDLEMCGHTIKIYAYLQDKEAEGCLEVFSHYRFRFFDRLLVERQIEDRIKEPWRIDQGYTSLCGLVCIYYILAKNDPSGYRKLAKDLHQKGVAVYNNYVIEPNKKSMEMYDVCPVGNLKHPKYIPHVDWITMATLRSKESMFGYVGRVGQEFSSINWPWLMKKLGRQLLGYAEVKMKMYMPSKSYLRNALGSKKKLRILKDKIDVDYNDGYEICLMIDYNMVDANNVTKYDISDISEYHWVNYEGGLEMLNEENKPENDVKKVRNVNFNVVTWGQLRDGKAKSSPKINLLSKAFIANYYGYLRLKK